MKYKLRNETVEACEIDGVMLLGDDMRLNTTFFNKLFEPVNKYEDIPVGGHFMYNGKEYVKGALYAFAILGTCLSTFTEDDLVTPC